MKIKSADKITSIQFEVEVTPGEITYFLRNWDYAHWEQLCGQSWEEIYKCDKLEELYQKYILTDEYKKLH